MEGIHTKSLVFSVYVVSEVAVGIMAVLANGFVFYVITYHNKNSRTSTDLYMINLLIADLVMGTFAPIISVMNYSRLKSQFRVCLIMNTTVNIVNNIAMLSLVCVAFDRYVLITKKTFHKRVVVAKITRVALVGIWIVGTMIGLLPYIPYFQGDRRRFRVCSYRSVINKRYSVYVQFFGFLIPLLVLMFAFYVRIFVYFRSVNRNFIKKAKERHVLTRVVSQIRIQREMKMLKVMAAIFFVSASCRLPWQITNTIRIFRPGVGIPYAVLLFSAVLTHANCFFNALIYIVSQDLMREKLNTYLLCTLKKGRRLLDLLIFWRIPTRKSSQMPSEINAKERERRLYCEGSDKNINDFQPERGSSSDRGDNAVTLSNVIIKTNGSVKDSEIVTGEGTVRMPAPVDCGNTDGVSNVHFAILDEDNVLSGENPNDVKDTEAVKADGSETTATARAAVCDSNRVTDVTDGRMRSHSGFRTVDLVTDVTDGCMRSDSAFRTVNLVTDSTSGMHSIKVENSFDVGEVSGLHSVAVDTIETIPR